MLYKDTVIKLLSGKTLSIEELSKQYDKEYVYSIDQNYKFFPTEIKSISKCYLSDYYEVKLDTRDYIYTSPDHLFITKELHPRAANLLKQGDSLCPMHFQINQESYNYGREMIYDVNLNRYVFTHHEVMHYMEPKDEEQIHGFDIHHIDENYLNNSPNNLMWLDSDKHKTFHEQERKNIYNKERDKNFANDNKRNTLITLGACLIRKYYILDKDLIESKKIISFLKYPIDLFLIDKYFETFDDFLNLCYNYETRLTDYEYARMTKSPEERKVFKKNAMAKIGRLLLDEGKEINETNYNNKMHQLHIKAQPFSKINKYFKTFENYINYVNKYNHKVVFAQIIKSDEKKPFYNIKLKNSNNLCICLEKDYLMIHS